MSIQINIWALPSGSSTDPERTVREAGVTHVSAWIAGPGPVPGRGGIETSRARSRPGGAVRCSRSRAPTPATGQHSTAQHHWSVHVLVEADGSTPPDGWPRALGHSGQVQTWGV